MRKRWMFLLAAAAMALGAQPALADESAGKAASADTAAAREKMEAVEAVKKTAAKELAETAETETEKITKTMKAESVETAETDGLTETTESENTETETAESENAETETDDTEVKTQSEKTVLEETSLKAVKEGEVAYVISIPCTVDLGTLNDPELAGGTVTVQSVSVKAKTVEGLSEGGGIAIYVRDDASDGTDFRLYGTDESNRGKSLSYGILIDGRQAGERSDADGNGCLVATFHEAGETAVLDLQFDQSQLPAENLSGWEGSYTGTLRFYSKQVGGNENNQGGA